MISKSRIEIRSIEVNKDRIIFNDFKSDCETKSLAIVHIDSQGREYNFHPKYRLNEDGFNVESKNIYLVDPQQDKKELASIVIAQGTDKEIENLIKRMRDFFEEISLTGFILKENDGLSSCLYNNEDNHQLVKMIVESVGLEFKIPEIDKNTFNRITDQESRTEDKPSWKHETSQTLSLNNIFGLASVKQKKIESNILVERVYNKLPLFYPYKAEEGDSLWKISIKNGWKLEELLSANPNIKSLDIIKFGQKINGLSSVETENYFELHVKISQYPYQANSVNLNNFPDPKVKIDNADYSIIFSENKIEQHKHIDYIHHYVWNGIRPDTLEQNRLVFCSSFLEKRLSLLETVSPYSISYAALMNQIWNGYAYRDTSADFPLQASVLILDLDHNNLIESTTLDQSLVLFDMNLDGRLEFTEWISGHDGFLVMDLNNNGVIDNISEIFSEYFGKQTESELKGKQTHKSSLEALIKFDSDKDQYITPRDIAWSKFRVWTDMNSDARTDQGELKFFEDLGIQLIQIQKENGNSYIRFVRDRSIYKVFSYSLISDSLGQVIEHNKKRGNNGKAIHPDGTETQIAVKNQSKELITNQKIRHISAASGNNTVRGDDDDNWLIGGPYSDTFYGGNGDDVLFIDKEDQQQNIDAGDGIDIAYVIDRDSKNSLGINMTSLVGTGIEILIGGRRNDRIAGGTNYGLFISGGFGQDEIIGGAANDVILGGPDNDDLEGGNGDDIIRGGEGQDKIKGNEGDDLIDGGGDDDEAYGGEGNDIFLGGPGNDRLDGGNGTDTVIYSGVRSEYKIIKWSDSVFQIIDRMSGRDGVDWLYNIEMVSFEDIRQLKLESVRSIFVEDQFILSSSKSDIYFMLLQEIIHNYLLAGYMSQQKTHDEIDPSDHACMLGFSDLQGVRILGHFSLDGCPDVIIPTITSKHEFRLILDSRDVGPFQFKHQLCGAKKECGTQIIRPQDGTLKPLKVQVTLTTPDSPIDRFYSKQSDLLRAIYLQPVWEDYTGKGIQILQVEESVASSCANTPWVFDYRHLDLKENIDKTWLHKTYFGINFPGFSRKATAVAGVMVAGRNHEGTVGIAYNAGLSGHCMPVSPDRLLQSIESIRTLFKQYDIVNYDGLELAKNFNAIANLTTCSHYALELKIAMTDILNEGRNGLGTMMIAGAHGQSSKGDTSTNLLSMSRAIIMTAAINSDPDEPLSSKSTFSASGISIFIAAPCSPIATTGYTLVNADGTPLGQSTEIVQGASFSAPIVSSVIALMLEANSELGWRDIQRILALSAMLVDYPDANFQYNHAQNCNGGGFHVSDRYGFGQINAHSAVRLAETWVGTHLSMNERILDQTEGSVNIDNRSTAWPIHDGQMVISCIELKAGLQVEHVEITLHLTHTNWEDLSIELVSPRGLVKRLVSQAIYNVNGSHEGMLDTVGPIFSFNTPHYLGEDAQGAWQLRMTARAGQGSGNFYGWRLVVFGSDQYESAVTRNKNSKNSHPLSSEEVDNIYYYTDEFEIIPDDNRGHIRDENGGEDRINAAATRKNAFLYLNLEKVSFIAGRKLIIDDNNIEHAITGDGDDIVVGNNFDNFISTGRGSDQLDGKSGRDCLDGGKGNNIMTGGEDADVFIIYSDSNSINTIMDFEATEEKIILVGFSFTDPDQFIDDFLTHATSNQEGTLIFPGNKQSIILKNVMPYVLNRTHFILLINRMDLSNYLARVTKKYHTGLKIKSTGFARGNENNDRIFGGNESNILIGGLGDDYIEGGEKDDIIFLEGDIGTIKKDNYQYQGTRVGGPGKDIFKLVSNLPSQEIFHFYQGGEISVSNLIADFNPDEGDIIDLTSQDWIRSLDQFIVKEFSETNPYTSDVFKFTGILITGDGFRIVIYLYNVHPRQLGRHHFLFNQQAIFENRGDEESNFLLGTNRLDLLDGGLNKDTMTGLEGDDEYVVEDINDEVIEGVDQGDDTVYIEGNQITSFSLPDNVENAIIRSEKPINIIGNKQDNRLVGNDKKNRLDGKEGSDYMIGGGGDDTYIVDHYRDRIIEYANQGVDQVEAWISWVLDLDVENLTLKGQMPINGIGNQRDNTIIGNNENNILNGMGGKDTLIGRGGSDTYVINFLDSLNNKKTVVTCIERAIDPGVDRLELLEVKLNQVQFQNWNNNLMIYVDKKPLAIVNDYYTNTVPTIEEFHIGEDLITANQLEQYMVQPTEPNWIE